MKKILNFIGGTILMIAFTAELYAIMVLGAAWQQQKLCENGVKTYCEGGEG